MTEHTIISPANGKPYTSRFLASSQDAQAAVNRAAEAFKSWRTTSIQDRTRIVEKFVDAFVKKKDEIAEELAWLMGR